MSVTSMVRHVWDFLQEQAVEAHVVGGYVRDQLLGRESRDVDFVVPHGAAALARRVADRFRGSFVLLDADNDVGRVVLKDERGQPFFADFARRRGGSLQADLAERDFTVDAMALDLGDSSRSPSLIDPHAGQDDLCARRLRAVSQEVFRADPLRLLRALRLAAELELDIERPTEAMIRRDSHLLPTVSAERIRDELVKVLVLRRAVVHLRRLDELGLLTMVWPELAPLKGLGQSPAHPYDAFEHSLRTVEAVEEIQETGYRLVAGGDLGAELTNHFDQVLSADRRRGLLLRLAALLHDVGKGGDREAPPLQVGAGLAPAQGGDREAPPLQVGAGLAPAQGGDREAPPLQVGAGLAPAQGGEQEGPPLHPGAAGAALAAVALHRLRFSAREARLLQDTVRHHHLDGMGADTALTDLGVYRFFRQAGDAGVDALLLSLADHLALGQPTAQPAAWEHHQTLVSAALTRYFRQHESVISPPPLVRGQDLMAELGLPSGPRVGQLLETVREAQVEGRVRTRAEALALVTALEAGE